MPAESAREELAFSFILEALTQGLYPNAFDVVREYISNAYDAVIRRLQDPARAAAPGEQHPEQYSIKVNVTGSSVFIADNGTGMNAQQARQYRYVGYSEKRPGEAAGFRGIGKLSGICVADKLIVTSSSEGDPRKYTLVFDARAMLTEILALRSGGRNKPLNDLIGDNTELSSDTAEAGQHFTVVEIHGIRPEFRELLDPQRLRSHVAAVSPVPFNPDFAYASRIDDWLIDHVRDYYYVRHLVNDEPVYKPFTNQVLEPQFLEVEAEEGGETIAYAWACQHRREEQLPDDGPRGLVFRLRNIAIGDGSTSRELLWHTNPHLAYWFFGEIHVVDPLVVPTAERSSFEANEGRRRLVDRSQPDLIRRLGKSARQQSEKANAEKKRGQLERLVARTGTALEDHNVPRETAIYEAAKLVTAAEQVRAASRRLAPEKQAAASELVKQAEQMALALSSGEATPPLPGALYNIRDHVRLGEAEWKLYDVTVAFLRDLLADDPEKAALAIRRFQERLVDVYGSA